MLSAHSASPLEARLYTVVTDYLKYHKFDNSLECIEAEYQRKLTKLVHVDGHKEATATSIAKAEILKSFDEGNVESFNLCWTRDIPERVRKSNVECQKVEFYVNIHCCLLPFRDPASLLVSSPAYKIQEAKVACAASVEHFTKYLNNRGQALSQTQEFLVYYALPYVSNPIEHPSFSPLFHSEWIASLRSRLVKFLDGYISESNMPELYRIYSLDNNGNVIMSGIDSTPTANKLLGSFASGSGKAGADAIKALRETPDGLREKEMREKFLMREEKLRDFAMSIYNLAIELAQALARTRQTGTLVQVEFLHYVQKRLETFALLLNTAGASDSPIPPTNATTQNSSFNVDSSFRKPGTVRITPTGDSVDGEGGYSYSGDHGSRGIDPDGEGDMDGSGGGNDINPIGERSISSNVSTQSSVVGAINTAAIRGALLVYIRSKTPEDDRKGALLLQALRWRLCKTKGKVKRSVLESYIVGDLLGLSSGDDSLLVQLLTTTDCPRIKEYTLRLINIMASESSGRSHLLGYGRTVPLMVDCLKSETTDSQSRQNALGSLQKFSLRRKPQSTMIKLDMINWTILILRNNLQEEGESTNTLSEYTVEYATALLMNLCLRSSGKAKAESADGDILSVLTSYMESENMQVRTYINGAVYSILSRPGLKERAMALGMDEVLKRLLDTSAEQFKLQIEYILKELEADPKEETASDDEGGEEEDSIEEGNDEEEGGEEDNMDDEAAETINAEGVEEYGEHLLLTSFKAENSGPTPLQEPPVNRATAPPRPTPVSTKPRVFEHNADEDEDYKPFGLMTADSPGRSDENGLDFLSSRTIVPEEMRSRDKIPRTPTGRKYSEEPDDPIDDWSQQPMFTSNPYGSRSMDNNRATVPSSHNYATSSASVKPKPTKVLQFQEAPYQKNTSARGNDGDIAPGGEQRVPTGDEYSKAFISKRELMRTPSSGFENLEENDYDTDFISFQSSSYSSRQKSNTVSGKPPRNK